MDDPKLMEEETSTGDTRDAGTQKLETPSGYPRLIRERNLRNICHGTTFQDANGNVLKAKMRPTSEFMDHFNRAVVRLAEAAINNALNDDRSTIMPQDIQSVTELIEEHLDS